MGQYGSRSKRKKKERVLKSERRNKRLVTFYYVLKSGIIILETLISILPF